MIAVYFPRYLAVPFVRADFPAGAGEVIARLAGRIDDDRMQELNRMTTIDGRSFAEVASGFLRAEGLGNTKVEDRLVSSILGNTITHLKLTAIALRLGCLAGLPLGIIVFRNRPVANFTVLPGRPAADDPLHCAAGAHDSGVRDRCKTGDCRPLPVFTPAHTAQYRYRAHHHRPGVEKGGRSHRADPERTTAHVLLPMALPNILAGVRTAAVISIGTATLAAFIGAGGLGEPIVTGLALNDTGLILQGALPRGRPGHPGGTPV